MILILLLSTTAMLYARYRILTPEGLAGKSDAICIAKVLAEKTLGEEWGYIKISTKVRVVQVLKGGLSKDQTMDVLTKITPPGAREDEDPPTHMPPVGSSALLFLSRNDKGDWIPAVFNQGIWAISGDGFADPYMPSVAEVTGSILKLKGK